MYSTCILYTVQCYIVSSSGQLERPGWVGEHAELQFFSPPFFLPTFHFLPLSFIALSSSLLDFICKSHCAENRSRKKAARIHSNSPAKAVKKNCCAIMAFILTIQRKINRKTLVLIALITLLILYMSASNSNRSLPRLMILKNHTRAYQEFMMGQNTQRIPNVFFVDTSPKFQFTDVSWCALESAALNYPDAEVRILSFFHQVSLVDDDLDNALTQSSDLPLSSSMVTRRSRN